MSYSPESWRFDPTLVKYELKIIEILGTVTRFKGVDPKYGILLGCFFLHPHLTQNQLQELTGISKSTFLPILKYLESIGFLQRDFIPGTHNYRYIASKTIQQFTIDMIINIFLLFSYYHQFLSNILQVSAKILIPPEKSFIIERINDLDRTLLNLLRYFEIFKANIPQEKLMILSTQSNFDITFKNITSFPDLELSLFQFFIQKPLFNFPKTSLTELFSHFFQHEHLTQSEIKTLSHLSIGTISQDLKTLTQLGVLHEVQIVSDIKKRLKIKTYALNPMKLVMQIYLRNLMSVRIQSKPMLIQMKMELERKNILKSKFGYEILMKTLDYMLSFYPMYENLLKNL